MNRRDLIHTRHSLLHVESKIRFIQQENLPKDIETIKKRYSKWVRAENSTVIAQINNETFKVFETDVREWTDSDWELVKLRQSRMANK